MFFYVIKFLWLSRSTRIVFGTSEILLLMLFSCRQDVFVFTGLGRLLLRDNWRASAIKFIIHCLYQGQKIVVLNSGDRYVINSVVRNANIIVLQGEGYKFEPPIRLIKTFAPISVAYVGRLLKSKGVHQLVDTCIQTPGNFKLYLFGDFDFGNSDSIDSGWLSEKIAHGDGKINYVGYVNDVKRRLEDVDIYVSMSAREGLPFSVLDALNSGCIVILNPVPGHLSFAGLKGVIFSTPSELQAVLTDIFLNPASFFDFDNAVRIKCCEQIFGFNVIKNDIGTILNV